jgi:putative transposase
MIPKNELNAEDIHGMMLEVMERHLSVRTEGYRSSTHETFNLLLKAVAEGSSLEAVCADSSGVVASNTLREQVNGALPVSQLRQQEAEMNAALQAAIPVGMPLGGLEVAIDTHDEPFYGKTPDLRDLRAYTCKTRAKAGTSRFFRIASAYVIWREVRLTLALTYVVADDKLVQVVERLLTRLKQVSLQATVLYLDKGFCSGEMLRYLQRIRQAAVLACPIRGKQGGIRALCVVSDMGVSPLTTPSPTGLPPAWRWSIPGCPIPKPGVSSANGWRLCWLTSTGHRTRSTASTADVLALKPLTACCVR